MRLRAAPFHERLVAASKLCNERVEAVNLVPRLLVVSIAFATACGRTNLGSPFVEPDAVAGEGGSSQGGTSNDAARGGIGGAPSGGAPATGGAGSSGSGGGGQSGMAGVGGMTCGDGIVAPHEACDPGSQPVAPAFELRQGTFRMPVLPIVGVDPATVHYAYDSRSSHTGFEQPGKSILYLYRWNEEAAMSVILLNGIDEDTTGLVQPPSNIVFDVAGLPDTAVIALSDDDIEFARITPSTARALWDCNRNSDGGVISGLSFPGTWHLVITPSFLAGITDWVFRQGTGSHLGIGPELALDRSQPVEIVASAGAPGCRADCTVPRCGDAIIDAGEVCDDGNQQPRDGCFACQLDF